MKVNYKYSSSVKKDFEYKCKSCEEVFTVQTTMSEMQSEVECKCSGTAVRYIGKAPIFSLDPISGDFIGATDKWQKGREAQMKREEHNMKEHGTYD